MTVELSEYLAALRKRWLTIVLLAILGGGAGYGLAQSTTPSFRATASVWVSLQHGETVSELAQGSTYTLNVVRSYAQLVTMPVVLEPVIEELGLDTVPRRLARTISASTPLDTSFIEISAVSGSGEEAARIANAVAAQLADTVEDLSPGRGSESPAVVLNVVSPAVAPNWAFAPNTKLMTATGAAGGIGLGMALALALALLDTRVRGAQDIRRVSDAAVLGSIPYVRGDNPGRITTLSAPQTPRAEAYRRLQTNLRYLDAAAGPVRTIVVVSAVPGEGKSSTALNLALAVAEKSQRVLLIDADLRRPSIARYTGIEGAVGLTTLLIGRAGFEDVVQSWGIAGLDILPSGEIPPNPSQLLDSPAMTGLLARAQQDYDLVILDAPPLLPVADAAVLARLADGAVLVAGCRRVKRHQVVAALASLDAVGAACLGVVLNAVAVSREETAYSYTSHGAKRRRWWRRGSRAQAPSLTLGPRRTEHPRTTTVGNHLVSPEPATGNHDAEADSTVLAARRVEAGRAPAVMWTTALLTGQQGSEPSRMIRLPHRDSRDIIGRRRPSALDVAAGDDPSDAVAGQDAVRPVSGHVTGS